MTRIGVSIVNYEAGQETLRCVESLLSAERRSGGACQLVIEVSDNHSSEADYLMLSEALAAHPHVSLHRNDNNLGFAAGHNRNIGRLLQDSPPDFLWLLNNDCEIEAGAVDALLCCARERPKVAIWGATLLDSPDGPIQCAGGCLYRAWVSSYRPLGRGMPLDRLDEIPEGHMDYVAGASMFMPVDTLLEGLERPRGRHGMADKAWLNETFFLYFEELDLAQRLRPGLELGWCRRALIMHSGGAGTGSSTTRRSVQGEFHSTLSALKYTHLYRPGTLWLMAPVRLLAKSLINLATLRFDLLVALYRAYGSYFSWRRAG